MKERILKEKSMVFAVRIVNLYQYLAQEKKEYVLSKQILRSGTTVGAMVREAEHSESYLDFIHKLAIAQKKSTKHCIGWNYSKTLLILLKMNMIV